MSGVVWTTRFDTEEVLGLNRPVGVYTAVMPCVSFTFGLVVLVNTCASVAVPPVNVAAPRSVEPSKK